MSLNAMCDFFGHRKTKTRLTTCGLLLSSFALRKNGKTRLSRSERRHFFTAVLSLCVSVGFGFVTYKPVRGDQQNSSFRPSSSDAADTAKITFDLPESLKDIYASGGVPKTLQQLIDMEQQQQRIAARVSACTVNVSIGAAQGCGVIISEEGFVLTAAHVGMRPGKTAIVTFSNGRTATATTLGMNRSVDAGLIKINDGQNNGKHWPHATLGSSDGLRAGTWCIATGHPGGYDRERGPVTRVGRILKVSEDSIVTDCALIGGDSGGPLFDLRGELIAVHSRIGNDVADNLHIPIQHYAKTWVRLKAGEAWGYLPGFRPVLGVRGDSKLPIARIDEVKKGSPAETAGLKAGDVVEQFGDVKVGDFKSLTVAVADTMPGERVPFWINRSGQSTRLIIEIGRAE